MRDHNTARRQLAPFHRIAQRVDPIEHAIDQQQFGYGGDVFAVGHLHEAAGCLVRNARGTAAPVGVFADFKLHVRARRRRPAQPHPGYGTVRLSRRIRAVDIRCLVPYDAEHSECRCQRAPDEVLDPIGDNALIVIEMDVVVLERRPPAGAAVSVVGREYSSDRIYRRGLVGVREIHLAKGIAGFARCRGGNDIPVVGRHVVRQRVLN